MKQELNKGREPERCYEYEFSGGVRGKYVGRSSKGSNEVVLDPDVAHVFTDDYEQPGKS